MAARDTENEPGETILATLTPRPARRWTGIGFQVALGLLLISLGTSVPSGQPLWAAGFIAVGGLILFGAVRLYRATADRIELTETELRDSAGRLLARIEDIRGVDRGAFAFKPSHGFLVRCETAGPRAWVPGLWWRVGRFVGVGGVTPANEAKAMAEVIAVTVAMRDAGPDDR